MRKEITDNGWDEITTVKIKIDFIVRNFKTNESWVDFNTRNPKICRNRTKCKCCGSNWDSNNSMVALAMTSKGNKCICQLCVDKFEKSGVKVDIHENRVKP